MLIHLMERESSQRRLQELLSAARGALEEALAHAVEHDLWFEFTGIRRGPGADLKTMNVNDPDEIALVENDIKEYGGSMPKTRVDTLDLAQEWVGSWC